MAKKRNKGSDGVFTIAGTFFDFASFGFESSQQVDDTSNYTDPATATSCEGSGCTTVNLTFAGFLFYGVASSAPGLAVLPGDPQAFTATFATGCTEAGNAVIERLGPQSRKVAGAIPVSGSARSSGAITETWATS